MDWSDTCVFFRWRNVPHRFVYVTFDITEMFDKSLVMRLARHIASIISWCQKISDTIYVFRCFPTSRLSGLIGATQEVTDRTGPCSSFMTSNGTVPLHMANFGQLLRLFLHLWFSGAREGASGLDKTPHGWIPALSVSPRAVWPC